MFQEEVLFTLGLFCKSEISLLYFSAASSSDMIVSPNKLYSLPPNLKATFSLTGTATWPALYLTIEGA